MRTKILISILILIPSLALCAERTYTVAGHSMEPALMPGDRVVVAPLDDRPLERGELVAISLKGMHTPMVKRVVAVKGDALEIRENALFVNNEKINNIDTGRWASTIKQLEHYGWRVPENNLFVLGDNPENSRDSRRLGLLSLDQISGRVVRVIK